MGFPWGRRAWECWMWDFPGEGAHENAGCCARMHQLGISSKVPEFHLLGIPNRRTQWPRSLGTEPWRGRLAGGVSHQPTAWFIHGWRRARAHSAAGPSERVHVQVHCAAKGGQPPSESSRMGWYHRDALIPMDKSRDTVKAIPADNTVSVAVSGSLESQEVKECKR